MKKIIISLFLFSLLAPMFPRTAVAQDGHFAVVTADQPNVWTLEQAHYLLAQMHRRNLDLKATGLGNLDPNEIHALNVDVLKQLVQVTAEYDQAKGFTNSQIKGEREFNSNRRMELLRQRAKLIDEQSQYIRRKAELQVQIDQSTDEEQKLRLQAMVNEIDVLQGAITQQIAAIDAELGTNAAQSGSFQSVAPTTTPFNPAELNGANESAFDKLVSDAITGFAQSPKLNASLRLENYLQMQYEILSKQLTLLRDEVGPGERLIFLEMPQSIRTSYDKADKKWAQSWWKIRAYTACKAESKEKAETIGDAAEEIRSLNRELKEFLDSIKEKITPTDLAKAYKDMDSAQKKLSDAARLIGRSSDVFESSSSANYSNQQDQVRSAARSALEDALKDLIAAINSLSAQLLDPNRTKTTDSIVAAINPPLTGKPNEREKKEYDEAVERTRNELKAEYALLVSSLKDFEKKELNDALMTWMRLNPTYDFLKNRNAADFATKLSTTPATITTDLKTLGISDASTAAIGYDLFLKAAGSREEPDDLETLCKTSPNTYNDTSRTIQDLMKGGPNAANYEVVDLDRDKTKDLPADAPLAGLFKDIKKDFEDLKRDEEDSKPLYPYLENREARIVDLFPRQSSLNVNEVKHRTTNMSLRFIFNFLIGFGGTAEYKRSRERFSQFVQQELYSAGFGKGGREFGWTFYPMPGTKRVASGARTTYSIMIVPKRANTIVLQSTGCYYDRSEKQIESFREALYFNTEDRIWKKGRCSEPRSFIVPIATAVSGENIFWVDRIDYQPVAAGRKITVSIRGRDFSAQTGILVDGVPLRPSLGLGQPLIHDDSDAAKKAADTGSIKGSYERVASGQLIASFEMGADYKNRTPQITLIAPGKALLLNTESRIRVNRDHRGLNDPDAPFMFGDGTAGKKMASVTSANIFKENDSTQVAIIQGSNLGSANVSKVFANASECTIADRTASFIRCTFPTADTPNVVLTLIGNDAAVQYSVANTKKEPPAPTVQEVKYETSPDFKMNDAKVLETRRKPKTEDDYLITYRITGKGIVKAMKAERGKLSYEDDNSAILILDWSAYDEVIGLTKEDGGKTFRAPVFLPVPAILKPKRNRPSDR